MTLTELQNKIDYAIHHELWTDSEDGSYINGTEELLEEIMSHIDEYLTSKKAKASKFLKQSFHAFNDGLYVIEEDIFEAIDMFLDNPKTK